MSPEIGRTSTTWFECDACGFRSYFGDRSPVCPRCGGQMRNVGVTRE